MTRPPDSEFNAIATAFSRADAASLRRASEAARIIARWADPEGEVWVSAFDAGLALSGLAPVKSGPFVPLAPRVAEIRTELGARGLVALARWSLQLGLVALDSNAIEDGITTLMHLASRIEHPETRLLGRYANGWRIIVAGDGQGALEHANEGHAHARRLGHDDLARGFSAQAVFAHELLGNEQRAMHVALRLRDESIRARRPLQALAAHVYVARCHRLLGREELATTTLVALAHEAPPSFAPWLGWELVLVEALSHVDTPAKEMPRAPHERLRALRDALARGDCSAASSHRETLRTTLRALPHQRADFETLLALVDADETSSNPHVLAWATGARRDVPRGLRRFAIHEGSRSRIVVGSNHARRILLVRAQDEDTSLVVPHDESGARAREAIALLALAPSMSLPEDALFHRLYGLRYEPLRHRKLLGVLVHRMRAVLASVASIERGSGSLVLRVHEPFVCDDPLSIADLASRVLDTLTTREHASARDLAEAIGVPLRTVQTWVGNLVAERRIERARRGREIVYALPERPQGPPRVEATDAWAQPESQEIALPR